MHDVARGVAARALPWGGRALSERRKAALSRGSSWTQRAKHTRLASWAFFSGKYDVFEVDRGLFGPLWD